MAAGKIGDGISRVARTALQLGAVTAVVEFVDTAVVDMSDRTYSASIVLGTVLLSALQVLVENASGKAVLRKVPGPDQPVVDSGPGA